MPKHILVADDDEGIVDLLRFALENAGYEGDSESMTVDLCWGTVCYGSPNCAWGVDRGFVNHVEYKPDMGFNYAYPLMIGGVGVVCLGLYLAFKRARWL